MTGKKVVDFERERLKRALEWERQLAREIGVPCPFKNIAELREAERIAGVPHPHGRALGRRGRKR